MGTYRPEKLAKCLVCGKVLSTPYKKHCKQHAPRNADHLFKYHGIGYPHSEESKIKISIAGKGRKASEETKKKMSLALMGHASKPHTEETKRRISETKKGKKPKNIRPPGWKHTDEAKRKIGEASSQRIRSEETKKKIGDSNRLNVNRKKTVHDKQFKKGHANFWKGKKRPIEHIVKMREGHTRRTGTEKRITPEHEAIRKSSAYKEWRREVFERDKFTCQKCLKIGGRLNAHHIKKFSIYIDLRLEINNGITLCESCHKEEETIRSQKRRITPSANYGTFKQLNMLVTIGNLIDQLSIVNCRIWAAENIKRNENATPEQIVKATRITNTANNLRNHLIQAIDERLNEIAMGQLQKLYNQGDTKMYGE